MIAEQRDPAFWRAVIEHPAVKPHVTLGRAFDIGPLVANARVLPLASENGGFLMVQLDGVGRVYELHTMFRPEGWGREVLLALKDACELLMCERGAQILTTYEVGGNKRSQPPKTFRFQAAGEFEACDLGSFKSWVLTKADWLTSPARRSMQCL